MFSREKIGVLLSEILGTAVLTMGVLTLTARTSFSVTVAAGLGLVLGFLVLTLGDVSGAVFNPAITIALWTVKKISSMQAIVYVVAQFLGALAAWRLFEFMRHETILSIADKNFDWRIFIGEVVGTFILAFGVATAFSRDYSGLKAAATVGGAIACGVLFAALSSNAVLNPAVAYGVQSVSKTYMVAPILGAVMGMNMYVLFFAPLPATKIHKK